jgi:hypothetical protein
LAKSLSLKLPGVIPHTHTVSRPSIYSSSLSLFVLFVRRNEQKRARLAISPICRARPALKTNMCVRARIPDITGGFVWFCARGATVSIARRGGRGRAGGGGIDCVCCLPGRCVPTCTAGSIRARESAQGRQRAARVIYLRRNLAPPEKYMCVRYQMRRSQKAPYITRQSHTNLTQSHGISANFTTTLFSYQSFRPLRDSPRLELASVFWVSQFI